RGVAEVPPARRASEIEHLPVNGLDFQAQSALPLVEVEWAGDAERAERLVCLEKIHRKRLHFGRSHIAILFAAFAGKTRERAVAFDNFVRDFAANELGH